MHEQAASRSSTHSACQVLEGMDVKDDIVNMIERHPSPMLVHAAFGEHQPGLLDRDG